MTVEPLRIDAAPVPTVQASPPSEFARALDELGRTLSAAESAEDRYAVHAGSLQEATVDRAQADVALAVATAVAQRSAAALQSILNMQV